MNYENVELTSYEKTEMLMEAQEHIFDAIDLIKQVFPDDGYVKAYMIDRLTIIASGDHGFLDDSLNMDKLIDRVR